MPEETAPVDRRRRVAVAGHLGETVEARLHLGDHDPAVRSTSLRALDRTGDLTADELGAALGDSAPAVRMAALELAATRRDVTAAAAAARLDDEDRRVVETAAWVCGEMPSDSPGQRASAVDALARVAGTHDDALCRESAIAALGAIGDRAGLSAILAGLDDKPEVRRRAVIALAPFEGPEVEAALARATTDRDRQVRTAAAELRAPENG